MPYVPEKTSLNKIAFYTESFLTPSMTFIYRQIMALPNGWESFVLARSRNNANLFPFSNVYIAKRTISERIINKLQQKLRIGYIKLGGSASRIFKRAMVKENPSLIHAHFGPNALEILPLARQLKIPMVTTFHGFDASTLMNNPSYKDQLIGLFSYSYILTVSETMRLDLLALGAVENRVKCVYIGVPIEKIVSGERVPIVNKHQNGAPINFLQVSNFVEKKGHRYTLAAFAELLEFYPQAKLRLAGDGYLRPAMEALADELKIRHAVDFLGHKKEAEVFKLMRDADCFLHHSVTADNGDKEGIPTVLMEAMASGLLVVTTNHAGIPELVQPNISGYLVEERDVNGYISILKKVLKDNGEIGRNAQSTIKEKFCLDKQMQLIVQVYDVCRQQSVIQ